MKNVSEISVYCYIFKMTKTFGYLYIGFIKMRDFSNSLIKRTLCFELKSFFIDNYSIGQDVTIRKQYLTNDHLLLLHRLLKLLMTL